MSPELRFRVRLERARREVTCELRHVFWPLRHPRFWFFARLLGLCEWLVDNEHDDAAVWLVATFMGRAHVDAAMRVLVQHGLPRDRLIA